MKFPNLLPGPSAIGARAALEHLNKLPMAALGDRAKTYPVQLTEPEINSIYAAVAFIQNEATTLETLAGGAVKMGFWAHYGPTFMGLSDRLSAEFDDSNAEIPSDWRVCPHCKTKCAGWNTAGYCVQNQKGRAEP